MPGFRERNERLENEKMAKQEMLRGLFVRLSDEVESVHYAPGVGGQITLQLNEKKKQLETLLEDNAENDELLEKRESLSRRLSKLGAEEESISQELSGQYKILGAILFEQKSMGTLDSRITHLDQDWEEWKALESGKDRGFFRRLVRGMDRTHFNRSRDEKYYTYGTGLFEAGQEKLVKGGNAEKAVAEISRMRSALAFKMKAADDTRYELDRLPAPEKSKEEMISDVKSEVWALRANHGQYLYENGQKWLREDTPSSLMDIIEEILKAEKEIERIDSSITGLSREAEKDEVRLLIDENRRRIEALRNEKKIIDEKILSLEKEIERMEEIL